MKNIISYRKSRQSFIYKLKNYLIFNELQRRAKAHNDKRGAPLSVFANDYIGININIHGLYDYEHLMDLWQLLDKIGVDTKKSIAIDIGANIGNHAIEFSKYFADVVCFEPNPRTFEILAANARQFKNIHVINRGCSSLNQKVKLKEVFSNIGGSSAVFKVASDNLVEISVKPLDEMIDSSKRVALIKVDVEGMEIQTLMGADRTISDYHPVICIEQHESEFDGHFYETESLDWLRSKGYKIFTLHRENRQNLILRIAKNLKQIIFGVVDERAIVEYKKLPKSNYPMIYAVHPKMMKY